MWHLGGVVALLVRDRCHCGGGCLLGGGFFPVGPCFALVCGVDGADSYLVGGAVVQWRDDFGSVGGGGGYRGVSV